MYSNKILTIIIPVYNEKNTIEKILKKVNRINIIRKQIIVVDDGSNDGTKEILIKNKKRINKLIHHRKNIGKGAAIRTAQKYVNGDIVVIQDADLEYNPSDYSKLLMQFVKGYKVVYGSRVLGKNRYMLKNFPSLTRIFFNHMLTIFSNILNSQNLTDAHTCYKMISSDLFMKLKLEENGFSFCPEINTKIGLCKVNIKEVPIKYYGRSYEQGKKIKLTDGIEAIRALIKYRFF